MREKGLKFAHFDFGDDRLGEASGGFFTVGRPGGESRKASVRRDHVRSTLRDAIVIDGMFEVDFGEVRGGNAIRVALRKVQRRRAPNRPSRQWACAEHSVRADHHRPRRRGADRSKRNSGCARPKTCFVPKRGSQAGPLPREPARASCPEGPVQRSNRRDFPPLPYRRARKELRWSSMAPIPS